MPIAAGNLQTKVKIMSHKIKLNQLLIYSVLMLCLLAIFLYASLVIVPQNNMGLLNKQAKPVWFAPGAHFTRPFSKITLVPTNLQLSLINLPTGDGSDNISIIWQIADLNKFWQATANHSNRINALFIKALNANKNYALTNDPTINAAGIAIQQVLLSGQNLSDTELTNTYQKMQNLAGTIAQDIIVAGNTNAQIIRAAGDQTLIDTENHAINQAAKIIGEGQAQAVELNAPSYQKNPTLFKLLVDTKAKMLEKQ